jgi:hypothetical protein
METILDILTGIGLASAAGIRPFLPGLAAGAFGAADLTIDYDHTKFSFLESPGWLLALVVLLIVFVVLQRRLGAEGVERGPAGAALSGLGLGIGAVLFAGTLNDHTGTWWPGIIGGLLFAYIAERASRDLLTRTRSRLDADAREALVVYADGTALVLAVLSILVPPLSIIAVGFLIWLLLGGRRREGEKYAGLRILR